MPNQLPAFNSLSSRPTKSAARQQRKAEEGRRKSHRRARAAGEIQTGGWKRSAQLSIGASAVERSRLLAQTALVRLAPALRSVAPHAQNRRAARRAARMHVNRRAARMHVTHVVVNATHVVVAIGTNARHHVVVAIGTNA